jgi:hypothetical protein
MRVYLGSFFLDSLIGLKLVEFICVVVLNFSEKFEFVRCRVIVLKISYH